MLILAAVLALVACASDPVSVADVGEAYLGAPGTTRTYRVTEAYFHPGTTAPFVTVPDSLRERVSFSADELERGLVIVEEVDQAIRPVSESPQPAELIAALPGPDGVYRDVRSVHRTRRLESELRNLAHNPAYEPHPGEGWYNEVWSEDGEVYGWVYLNGPLTHVRVRKPLAVGAEWVVRQREYRTEGGGTGVYREEARVVGQERVRVGAGEFLAFEVEVAHRWPPGDPVVARYEYYVPGVGLVLEESDGLLTRPAASPGSEQGETERLRRVTRRELVAYDVR